MNRLLTVVVLVLLAHSGCQYMKLRELRAELRATHAATEQRAQVLMRDTLENRTAELTRAGGWLHDFYQSEDGLQRPRGLWLDAKQQPDFEAIVVWLMRVYLPARLGGASEADARRAVVEQIRQTDEWKRKHPGVS